jgi:hypothetical protein
MGYQPVSEIDPCWKAPCYAQTITDSKYSPDAVLPELRAYHAFKKFPIHAPGKNAE